jgi:hypothetical protein
MTRSSRITLRSVVQRHGTEYHARLQGIIVRAYAITLRLVDAADNDGDRAIVRSGG